MVFEKGAQNSLLIQFQECSSIDSFPATSTQEMVFNLRRHIFVINLMLVICSIIIGVVTAETSEDREQLQIGIMVIIYAISSALLSYRAHTFTIEILKITV
jgi:hypothetical protein